LLATSSVASRLWWRDDIPAHTAAISHPLAGVRRTNRSTAVDVRVVGY
jgi:hypothetical protein